MKSKFLTKNGSAGFTLVELLVVLSIMVLVSGIITIDFNRQKASRNIILAKNETATNIRKVQNYLLSSRNLSDGSGAKFYILTFDLNAPTSYKVQAVDNAFGFHDNEETINLPPLVNMETLVADGTQVKCLQVIFMAPLGTMYINSGSGACVDIASKLQDPVELAKLSQNLAYVSFSGVPPAPGSKYIQISPLTGQVTAF